MNPELVTPELWAIALATVFGCEEIDIGRDDGQTYRSVPDSSVGVYADFDIIGSGAHFSITSYHDHVRLQASGNGNIFSAGVRVWTLTTRWMPDPESGAIARAKVLYSTLIGDEPGEMEMALLLCADKELNHLLLDSLERGVRSIRDVPINPLNDHLPIMESIASVLRAERPDTSRVYSTARMRGIAGQVLPRRKNW